MFSLFSLIVLSNDSCFSLIFLFVAEFKSFCTFSKLAISSASFLSNELTLSCNSLANFVVFFLLLSISLITSGILSFSIFITLYNDTPAKDKRTIATIQAIII